MVLQKLKTKTDALTAHVPKTWQSMREAREFMYDIDPLMYRFGWGMAIFNGISGLGAMAFIGVFFQSAVARLTQHTDQIAPGFIIAAIAIVILYRFANEVLELARKWRTEALEQKISVTLERQNMDVLRRMDTARLSDPTFQMLKDKATRWLGRSALPNLFEKQLRAIGAITGLTASVGFILVLDPLFILLAVLPVIIATIKDVKHDAKKRELWSALHPIRRVTYEYEHHITQPHGLLQSTLFGFVDYWRGRYDTLRETVWQHERALNWWSMQWNVAMAVVSVLTFAVVTGYLGHKLLSGTTAFSEIFILWGSIQTLGGSFGRLSTAIVDIRVECLNYAYRKEFLATQPFINEDGARAIHFTSTPTIELRGVSFRYPRTTRQVLRDCSFTLKPGEVVALVGSNGAGKTSLLRLMAKTYLPDEGAVTLAGIPTTNITQSSWLSQMLLAMQDMRVPELRIEESLTGTALGTADIGRLAKAAEHAQTAKIIAELPHGYRTQIGEDWIEGWEPSTGQRQRLAVTSAMYRALDPQVRVVLIDEPMSQCDVDTRDWFYKNLRALQGRTVVVVAHDPMYLHYFTRIIVIENGTVARDITTHDEIVTYQREVLSQHDEVDGNVHVLRRH